MQANLWQRNHSDVETKIIKQPKSKQEIMNLKSLKFPGPFSQEIINRNFRDFKSIFFFFDFGCFIIFGSTSVVVLP
jgi:hypothetical protein